VRPKDNAFVTFSHLTRKKKEMRIDEKEKQSLAETGDWRITYAKRKKKPGIPC